jgi:DNA-binding transcriptional regulator YiaG
MCNQIDVKALRALLGWTQAQLGLEMGVDQSTVSHWEAGGKPRGPALKLLQSLWNAAQTKASTVEAAE